jgi:hypothetical protein
VRLRNPEKGGRRSVLDYKRLWEKKKKKEGLFESVTFSTSKHLPATSCRTFIAPHSALLTLNPVAFQLDTGDLHAVGQNPHKVSPSDSPVPEVTPLEVSYFSHGNFVAGFRFSLCDWLAFFTCSGDVECVTRFLFIDGILTD